MRPAQEGDLSQVVNLGRLAFAPLKSDAVIKQQWYDGGTLNLPGRFVFLAVDDQTGLAVGKYTELDLSLFLTGQLCPMMGIGGVAVAPHKRGQKIARLMLEQALKNARSQQFPLSMLYPFQHGFYRQLGWAWVGMPYQYRVSTRHLPLYEERAFIQPHDPTHNSTLQAIYEQAATQHNGWLQRREWQWQSHFKLEAGEEVYRFVTAGECLGYVMIQFTHLNPPQQSLSVVVQEWVALTVEAYRGIVGFLAALRDQVQTVVWNTNSKDPFPHLLKEQRQDPILTTSEFEFGLTHRFGEVGGGFMWRLVDLPRSFQLRPVNLGAPFALTFHVIDPILGEQILPIEFSDGQMHVLETATSTVVRMSIEHLTALFSGFRCSSDLYWTGEIELEGEGALLKQLDAAWQASSPFCWDFF